MIINATPHELSIRLTDGSMIAIPPCGSVVRCAEERVADGEAPLDNGALPTSTCRLCAGSDEGSRDVSTDGVIVITDCTRCHGGGEEWRAIPLSRVEYGAVEGLAACELRPGDVLVVSLRPAQRLAAEYAALRARVELASADGRYTGAQVEALEAAADAYLPAGVTVCAPGPAIRDADGRIIGCDGLTVVCRT